MLTMRDQTVHHRSATAEHTFRRLHQANIVVFVLLGLLLLLGIWNVWTLTSIIRSDARDLADVGSIHSHISAQLITWVSIVTLAVFVFKEWRWGERSLGGVFVLAGLLFLWLVPVMSAEVEPTEESMQVAFTLNHCEPGAIEGSTLVDSSLCLLVSPDNMTMFMTASDPLDGDPEWLAPDEVTQFGAGWNVEARGRFRVYFLLEQDSIEQCRESRLVTSVPPRERYGHQCLEQDGQVWLVQAYETSHVETKRLIIYQEVEP